MIKIVLKTICLIIIFTLTTGCANDINLNPFKSTDRQENNTAQLNINNSDDDSNEIILQIDFGDDRIITNHELRMTNYENQYLWPAMKEVLEKNKVYLDFQDYGGDLGVFIKQIGDKKNGEDGKYWQYLVNGEYAKIGVSNYKIKPKDVILWQFTSSYKL